MLQIDFPERNKIYTKPKGYTDEQCGDLPVWEGQAPIDETGTMTHIIISKWQFSKEDLEEIQRTGCIYLSVNCNVMIPVSLFTENPFTYENKQ